MDSNEMRNDVLAEIMAGFGKGVVGLQFATEQIRIENIDAHGCQRTVRVVWQGLGVFRLFVEFANSMCVIHRHDAKRTRAG